MVKKRCSLNSSMRHELCHTTVCQAIAGIWGDLIDDLRMTWMRDQDDPVMFGLFKVVTRKANIHAKLPVRKLFESKSSIQREYLSVTEILFGWSWLWLSIDLRWISADKRPKKCVWKRKSDAHDLQEHDSLRRWSARSRSASLFSKIRLPTESAIIHKTVFVHQAVCRHSVR